MATTIEQQIAAVRAELETRPKGLIRHGRKSVRWPLGFLAARRVVSAAVVNEKLGRVFRAELESPREPDESLVREAVSRMDAAQAYAS